MNKILSILFLSLNVCLFVSCNSHAHDDHGHEHATSYIADHHDGDEAMTTSLTPEQMQSIDIQLGQIEKKQLSTSLKANGKLKVPNQNKANATAMLGGVVKSILVQSGGPVRKGQVVATISNSAFITLQEEYLSASAQLILAEQDLLRQKELAAGNATAQKNLQVAQAHMQTLKIKKASLQKQLELIGINASTLSEDRIQSDVQVASPIAGAISDVRVNIGSYVEAHDLLVEVVDNSQLHLDLFVYEKDLPKLTVGQTVHFTLTNNPGREYDADIYAISNTFEPESKAVAVHAKVKGKKEGLIDGMSVTALVSLDQMGADAVPEEAIVSHGGQDFIFIVKGKASGEEAATTFEKVPVRKGTTDVGYSEITLLNAIPAGSQIVTKGAFFILAKMTNQGEAHSH